MHFRTEQKGSSGSCASLVYWGYFCHDGCTHIALGHSPASYLLHPARATAAHNKVLVAEKEENVDSFWCSFYIFLCAFIFIFHFLFSFLDEA